MHRRIALAAVLVCACQPRAQAPPAEAPRAAEPAPLAVPANLVDLTHAFGEETIYWPTDEQGFGFEVLAAGVTEAGFYYAANRFRSAEHGGTHLDAPIHFYEGRATVDAVPLERLIAPGVVVDVTAQVAADRDYLVGVADFEAWEAAHGRLADGVTVLLRTGFGQHWPDRAAYLGTDLLGPQAIPELHFPGLDPRAAEWLTRERSIAAIGIDTASIDRGQSKTFESHVILCGADVPAFENVAALDRLPAKDFLVAALPMKIRGGSGGPLRIVAMW